jgi:hypothetical protein
LLEIQKKINPMHFATLSIILVFGFVFHLLCSLASFSSISGIVAALCTFFGINTNIIVATCESKTIGRNLQSN